MGYIEERRSIRSFKNQKIEPGKLKAVLQAGLMAPSPKNRQPWKFIIFDNPERKNDLVESMRYCILEKAQKYPNRIDVKDSLITMDIIEEAPAFVLICYVCGTTEHHDDGVNWGIAATDLEAVELQAIGAAVENMLLKAEELGLGGLWCADILYAYPVLQKISDFPIVSAVCLGYKAEYPTARERKNWDEVCIFY